MITTIDTQVLIEVAFVEPLAPITTRQAEALFAVSNEASIEALYIEARADRGFVAPIDSAFWRWARGQVPWDADLPRITEISLGSPFHIKLGTKELAKAAAMLLALGIVFGKADVAMEELDKLVQDTTTLVEDIGVLVETTKSVVEGNELPREDYVPNLRRGTEPPIELNKLRLTLPNADQRQ